MKLILLGAPGAGKGTQAEIISETLRIPTISTGNIIREALKSGTELGRKAKGYMDSGQLVPDDIVIGIIRDRLAQPDCADGFILDGFPRTIPHDTIARRVSGRRICPSCGSSYHVDYKRPTVEGICDRCGDTLVQRQDDRPDTVRERLSVYHEQTEPLKSYYAAAGKLFVVEGQEEIADTSRLVLAALEQ